MIVPWPARRSNQSILKEISPGISLEGMMLKLKLQYFGHLMRSVDSLAKTLMLGGSGGRRRRGRQRIRCLDGITDSIDVSLSGSQESVENSERDGNTRPPDLSLEKSVCRSVQFSHSVVSDYLRPHELQHARPPSPSPAPRVHPNPCSSSQ